MAAISPSSRATDWPSFTVVAAGTQTTGYPIGAAIRTWGPTGDVFIAVDQTTSLGGGAFENDLTLDWYTCSNSSCTSATHNSGPVAIGDTLPFNNAIHPALAIRSDNGIRYLKIVGRQKLVDDCDGDSSTTDLEDTKAIDLNGWNWNSQQGLVNGFAIETNVGRCFDTGFAQARFLSGTAWSCYTFSTNPTGAGGGAQNLGCNNDSSLGTYQWSNHLDLSTSGQTVEDHPSFDFYGPGDDLAVAGHLKVNGDQSSGPDQARVHFPDAAAPPSEPIVAFASTSADEAQHPSVVTSAGMLHLVYHTGSNANAAIRFAECDFDATHDCTTQGTGANVWPNSSTSITANSGYEYNAKMAQFEADGDNEFVVYQYDAAGGSGSPHVRVVVGSRCRSGSWTFEYVREEASSTRSQSVFYGRPSLVLNRTDHVAHVVFVEADSYDNNTGFAGNDADVYWYRKPYTVCQ